jgi:hypothetical protein
MISGPTGTVLAGFTGIVYGVILWWAIGEKMKELFLSVKDE